MGETRDTPLLYSVAQATELLGVGKWQLYEFIRSGQLRTVKIGRRRLVPADALVELVEQLVEASAGGRAA